MADKLGVNLWPPLGAVRPVILRKSQAVGSLMAAGLLWRDGLAMNLIFRKSLFFLALLSALTAERSLDTALAGIIDGTFELDGNATKNPSIAGDDWGVLFPIDTGSTAIAKVFITDTTT